MLRSTIFLIIALLQPGLFCFAYIQTDTVQINLQTQEAYKNARINPNDAILMAGKALSNSVAIDFQKGISDAYLALGAAYQAKYNPGDSASIYYHKALKIYEEQKNLLGQARACYGLCYLYNFNGNPQKSKEYGELSIAYFEQTGSPKEVIAALIAVVFLTKQEGDFEYALELSKKAIELAKTNKDTLQWADVLNNQGNIFKDMFLFNEAIDSYFEAFRLWELKKDSAGLAISYGSIANVYFFQEDFRKSLEFNFKKLPITQKSGNLWEASKTINNIVLAYSDLNKHDSALIYSQQGLKIAEIMNYPSGVANSCDIMASVFIKMGKPDSAYFYSNRAVSIAEKTEDQNLASYLLNRANALEMKAEYKAALFYANKAYKLASNRNDSHTLRSASYLLSRIYRQLNQRELAYNFLAEYNKLNDSITNKEFLRKVTRLDIQHEYDKKQRATAHEIEILDKTNQLKTEKLRKTWIVLIALLLLSLAGALISFLVIRNKNHQIEQMNLELRNYLLQLDNLKTGQNSDNPILSLVTKYGLTQRETEIMELIATGIGNEEIAEKLFVSKNTIKFHIKNIFIKLDVRNRVQALHKVAM